MKSRRLLLVPLVTGPFIVATGFIHEAGHIAAALLVGIEVEEFPVVDCLLLHCRVYLSDPLEGPAGFAVLSAGGLTAGLWWAAVYLATRRLHRTGHWWWTGALPAALMAGEFMSAVLEGGFNAVYTGNLAVTLILLVVAASAGFVAHMQAVGQWHRLGESLIGQ